MTHTFIIVFCQSSFFLNCIPTFCQNMFNISFDPIRIGNNKKRILRTHLPINTPFKTATSQKVYFSSIRYSLQTCNYYTHYIRKRPLCITCKHKKSNKSCSSNTSWLVVTSCVNLPSLSLSVFVNIKYKLA